MTPHLTSQQVAEWRAGVSSPEELLRLDDHLAECADCRAFATEPNADANKAALRHLQAEFSSPHLSEAQLDDYAARRPLPADVMTHIDGCADCRADAEDLRKFVAEVRPEKPAAAAAPGRRTQPVWLRPIAAVFAIAALGTAAWFTIGRQHAESAGAPAAVETASNIPPQFRDEIKTAVDSGSLRIPDAVTAMSAGPIQLRSTDVKPPAFRLAGPLSTAVLEDTPLFRWTAIPGATYTISVYDDQFHAVASSGPLNTTEWRPEKPLARGAVYRWEVHAALGKRVESAPAPTEPEAKFLLLDEAAAKRLTDARAAMPDAPLALGILYANAGVLEEAKSELTKAANSGDPQQQRNAARLLAGLH